jgi:Zn-finger nucleic acid-binding protein
LEQVIATKEEQFSDALTQSTIRQARAGVPDSEINAPLACPICKTATQVLNFDYNSGVIVNRCIKHGVWFDANELMRIQAFMEHWEVHKSKLKAQWQKDYDRIQGETAKLVSELDSAPLKSSLTVRILYFLMNKGKL